jgi:hypothetical protein
LQIIFNPFGINACAKLFDPKFSRIMRFGPGKSLEKSAFRPKNNPEAPLWGTFADLLNR